MCFFGLLGFPTTICLVSPASTEHSLGSARRLRCLGAHIALSRRPWRSPLGTSQVALDTRTGHAGGHAGPGGLFFFPALGFGFGNVGTLLALCGIWFCYGGLDSLVLGVWPFLVLCGIRPLIVFRLCACFAWSAFIEGFCGRGRYISRPVSADPSAKLPVFVAESRGKLGAAKSVHVWRNSARWTRSCYRASWTQGVLEWISASG